MTATLTERYIAAAIRSIPTASRNDVQAAFSQALAEASVGEIIGSSLLTGLYAIVLVAFWVTRVFAVLERSVSTANLPD